MKNHKHRLKLIGQSFVLEDLLLFQCLICKQLIPYKKSKLYPLLMRGHA